MYWKNLKLYQLPIFNGQLTEEDNSDFHKDIQKQIVVIDDSGWTQLYVYHWPKIPCKEKDIDGGSQS